MTQAFHLFIRVMFTFRYDFIYIFCGLALNLESALSLKSFVNSFGCGNIYLLDITWDLLILDLCFN